MVKIPPGVFKVIHLRRRTTYRNLRHQPASQSWRGTTVYYHSVASVVQSGQAKRVSWNQSFFLWRSACSGGDNSPVARHALSRIAGERIHQLEPRGLKKQHINCYEHRYHPSCNLKFYLPHDDGKQWKGKWTTEPGPSAFTGHGAFAARIKGKSLARYLAETPWPRCASLGAYTAGTRRGIIIHAPL